MSRTIGKRFDAKGVHPEHISSLADLVRLPFTTKADLRANYPFGTFDVPRERVGSDRVADRKSLSGARRRG